MIFCFEGQEINTARELMRRYKVRRLPVVNRQRDLVSMLALSDNALATGDAKSAGIAIQEISIPDAPKPLPRQKRE